MISWGGNFIREFYSRRRIGLGCGVCGMRWVKGPDPRAGRNLYGMTEYIVIAPFLLKHKNLFIIAENSLIYTTGGGSV